MEIGKLIEAYLTNLGVQFKLKTVASYAQRLERFRHFCEKKGVLLLSELTAHLLERYRLSLKTVRVNTRYVYLDSVKRFCEWLYEEDYLFFMIAQGIALPKWERKKKVKIGHLKAKVLVEGIGKPNGKGDMQGDRLLIKRNQAIAALGLMEGLRLREIRALSLLDVDFMTKRIRVVARKRFIALYTRTEGYLKTYLKERGVLKPQGDGVFIGRGGKRMDAQTIGRVIRDAKRDG